MTASPGSVPARPRAGRSEPPAPATPTPAGLLELYRPDLVHTLEALDTPPYRYAQVLEHLLRRPDTPFSEATALPTGLRLALAELGHNTLETVAHAVAADGTTKFLLGTRDGHEVETVLMPYGRRATVCVSSQVGCPVGCLFCATGGLGFRRDLSAAEIVDQVRLAAAAAARTDHRLSNVVYMGMGEPLLNLPAVLASIRLLTYPRGLGLSRRALSVSTIGLPAGIRQLARAEPQVNLALSLHAATDELRRTLIPGRYCRPLAEVLAAAREHFALTHRKLLVEYLLLKGVNDRPEDARDLARLLNGMVVTVNLLPWNPGPRSSLRDRGGAARPRSLETAALRFAPSPPVAIQRFAEILGRAGIEAVVRRSKGAEILAACGQLAADRGSYRVGS